MFLSDSSRPASGQFVPERLGLAEARERVPEYITNQAHDFKSLCTILFDPPFQIFEGG